MIISKKAFREEVERRIEEERRNQQIEKHLETLSRELYSEVGRLETLIRDIERRVLTSKLNAKEEIVHE